MNVISGKLVKDSDVEFMPILNDKLEKEVISFLNSAAGGYIYIGVSYDGAILGVDALDNALHTVADRLRVNISPNCLGLTDVFSVEINGKKILKVVIARGTEKPYYLRLVGMTTAGCFVRSENVIKQMDSETVRSLAENVETASLKNIISPRNAEHTFAQLKIYYQERGISVTDDLIKNLDFYTREGRINYAGYLFADSNKASVQLRKYYGTDNSLLIETGEYGNCSLVKTVYRLLDKLEVENRTFTVSPDESEIQHHELINTSSLREAVVNAVVHNDYTRDIMPSVDIYSDRLIITSFGGIPEGLTEYEFLNGRPMPRNRELVRVFKDLGLTGYLGSGINTILEKYDQNVFKISENSFQVTLPFTVQEVPKINSIKKEMKYIRTKDKIIEIINNDENITAAGIAEKAGVTKKAVEWHLKKLKASGILERLGSRKTGVWKIRV